MSALPPRAALRSGGRPVYLGDVYLGSRAPRRRALAAETRIPPAALDIEKRREHLDLKYYSFLCTRAALQD